MKKQKDYYSEVNKKKNTKAKSLLSKIFGQKALVILLLLLQVALYVAIIGKYYMPLSMISSVFSIFLIIFIVNRNYNPAFKIAWILVIVTIPIFGCLIFLLSRVQITRKFFNHIIIEKFEETRPFLKQSDITLDELKKDSKYASNIATYVHKYAGYPIHMGTTTEYFSIGELFFADLKQELSKAEHFIFMEFFIVDRGSMWREILDILIDKVKHGVDVRLIYDGMGAQTILPFNYAKKLNRLGIKCRIFNPFVPMLSSIQNNRDHRKIIVIDGHTAYTGGVNIADEYINQKVRFGHWKDTAIKLHGEAVVNFTMMFFNMWNYTNNSNEDNYSDYFPHKYHAESFTDDGYVMPYGDIPIDDEHVGKNVYIDIIFKAKDYVYIMTPYLILDSETLTAIEIAAKSGVKIKLILPGIPDKWYVYVIAQSFYKQLLDMGVEIYEYSKGFVHAKSFVSDDIVATVGTINLDFRSLYLHFEDAVFMYKTKSVMDVKFDFKQTLKECTKVDYDYISKIPFGRKLAGVLLKILSPML
ncbi:MAG: cardiolipin synthase [Ruminococcus sp.]|nr:cardiolipin synthase [Ruminococcus sp.]